MDEKLKEVLNGMAIKSLDGIENMVTNVQANAPGLIEEFLRWRFFSSFVGWIIWIVLAVIGFKTIEKIFKMWPVIYEKDMEPLACIIGIVLGIAGIVGFVGIFVEPFEWLKIWIAPRLYLLEYAINLVKSKP